MSDTRDFRSLSIWVAQFGQQGLSFPLLYNHDDVTYVSQRGTRGPVRSGQEYLMISQLRNLLVFLPMMMWEAPKLHRNYRKVVILINVRSTSTNLQLE